MVQWFKSLFKVTKGPAERVIDFNGALIDEQLANLYSILPEHRKDTGFAIVIEIMELRKSQLILLMQRASRPEQVFENQARMREVAELVQHISKTISDAEAKRRAKDGKKDSMRGAFRAVRTGGTYAGPAM